MNPYWLHIHKKSENSWTKVHSGEQFHAELNGAIYANYEADKCWNGKRIGSNANRKISVGFLCNRLGCSSSSNASFHFSFHNLFSSRRYSDNAERPSFSSHVSTVLLRFKDKRWECSYMKEPDLMLKYSTFMCLAVLIGIIGIQALNNPWVNFWQIFTVGYCHRFWWIFKTLKTIKFEFTQN